MSIECLPVELLTHTLALSKCPRTVWSALLTCKQFSSAARVHTVPKVWRGFPLVRVLGRHWGTGKCVEGVQLNIGSSEVLMKTFSILNVCTFCADVLRMRRYYNLSDGQLLREHDYVLNTIRSWYPSGTLQKCVTKINGALTLVERWDRSGLQIEHGYLAIDASGDARRTGRRERIIGDVVQIVKTTDGTIDGDELHIRITDGTVRGHCARANVGNCATANVGQFTPVCLHASIPNCVSCTEYRSVILAQHKAFAAVSVTATTAAIASVD